MYMYMENEREVGKLWTDASGLEKEQCQTKKNNGFSALVANVMRKDKAV